MEGGSYHEDNKIKFFRHLCSSTKESIESTLSFGEFTTTDEVTTIKRHDTINNEKTIFIGGEVLGKALKHLLLHLTNISRVNKPRPRIQEVYLCVLRASIDNILQGLFGINTKSLCNFRNSFRSKCTLSVCTTIILACICHKCQSCSCLPIYATLPSAPPISLGS